MICATSSMTLATVRPCPDPVLRKFRPTTGIVCLRTLRNCPCKTGHYGIDQLMGRYSSASTNLQVREQLAQPRAQRPLVGPTAELRCAGQFVRYIVTSLSVQIELPIFTYSESTFAKINTRNGSSALENPSIVRKQSRCRYLACK